MKKEHQQGLYIGNNVKILEEKQRGFSILSRLLQFMVIVLGVWGFFGGLMESINLPVNLILVNLVILLSAGLIYALSLFLSFDLIKLISGFFLYGLFFYDQLPRLLNGFYIAENKVIERLERYYEISISKYIADYTTEVWDTTILVIFLVFPLVLLLTVAVVRRHMSGFAVVLLFLPISVSFAFGLIPSERYLISYIIVVIYLIRSSDRNHNIKREQRPIFHRINSSAAVWLSVLCLVLIFGLKLFISEADYSNVTTIKKMKKELQTKLLNLSLEDVTKEFQEVPIFSSNKATGGLKGGELGKVGEIEYSESEQLRITAPYNAISKGVYLKGYVGSVYTGESWDEHSKENYAAYSELIKELPLENFSPVNQVNQLIRRSLEEEEADYKPNFMIGEMTVEYEDANKKYMYAPYYTNFILEENTSYEQDLYAAPIVKKDSYTFQYYYDDFSQNSVEYIFNIPYNVIPSEEYLEKESLYRDYVYNAYTQVPEEGLEQLKQEMMELKVTLSDGTIYDKILYVQNYLEQNTKYSLTPGVLPKNKDFVEYFLYENQKGFCAHYASATTLMLRLLGIPTRYVEGYAIGASDIERNKINEHIAQSYVGETIEVEVSVKDYNAHAWVEVYVDYIGWIPVDLTPASEIGYASLERSNLDDATLEMSPTPPLPTKEPQVPEQETKPKEEEKTETQKGDQYGTAGEGVNAQSKKTETLLILLIVFFVIVGLVVTCYFWLQRRKKSHNLESYNKRAIRRYVQIERIINLTHKLKKQGLLLEESEEYVRECYPRMDANLFTSCMEIVRKARFGKREITMEEYAALEAIYHYLKEEAEKELGFGKRMYLKLLSYLW